jgi:nicotinamide riboside kinase
MQSNGGNLKVAHKIKVINLLGGPGCGKSTNALGITNKLKRKGQSIELIDEYAKELFWRKDHSCRFKNQIDIVANQYNKQLYLQENEVKLCVTDSPIILSMAYKPSDYFKSFDAMVLEIFNSFDNLNFFLVRDFPFVQEGRIQNESESKELSDKIMQILMDNNIPIRFIKSNYESEDIIIKIIESELTD